MNNIEIKQLNYFLQVASLLNINETARQLGISQPAVTRQIQQIEESVGMILFRRSPSGLKLTSAGESFYHRTSRFIRDYQDSIQHTVSVNRESQGMVVLGVDSGMFLVTLGLGRILADFRKDYPRFEIRPIDDFSGSSIEALLSRELDMLLTTRSLPSDYAGLVDSDVIEGTRTDVIVKSDHPFSKAEFLSIEELHDLPIITLDEDYQPGFLENLEENFARKNSRLNVVQTASTETTLLGYIHSGIGIAIVNGSIFKLQNEALRSVELMGLDVTTPTRVRILARRGENYPALDAFRQHLLSLNMKQKRTLEEAEEPLIA
ncbi:MAG: LysR family transcriptional regulator [Verrucomicrobiota bacterium]